MAVNHLINGVVIATLGLSACAEPLVKDGERIAFIGDSITEFGDWGAGYINMVVKGLGVVGVKVGKIPVGHSAETSQNMAKRFDRDVVAAKPDWVTISCGVNDVARMKNAATGKVDYDAYRRNVRSMLDRAKAAGIRPVLLTPTLRYEEKPESDENRQIVELCAFLKEEAKTRGIPIADLNTRMRETLAKLPPAKGPRLTRDGVHMNFAGNAMMATGVLQALGVEVTPAIEAAWRDLPDGHSYYQWLTWDEAQRIEAVKKPGEDRKHCAERLIREGVAAGKVPTAVRPPAAKPANLPVGAPEIVFLGDRVMAWGRDQECGWVNFVRRGLEASEGRPLPAHVFAWWLKDETENLMEQSTSLAAAKPKRAVLMLGSREMRPKKGPKEAEAALAKAKERMLRLIDAFTAAKTETVVCGQPIMSEDPESADNGRVVAYNAWLKEECAKRGAKFVDLYAIMTEGLKARTPEKEPFGQSWFVSGWYHMIFNFRGHALAAESVLAAFGVKTTPEMKEQWRHASGCLQPQLGFSLNEWDALSEKAKAAGMDVTAFASSVLKLSLQ